MRKGTITNRTIARDMMNMLRPDSILNKDLEKRHILPKLSMKYLCFSNITIIIIVPYTI